mmetsp:Transcript_11670/g.41688  ORF Transcript_11670/g.41688 Transcript_11670/m.41688 type:complete len:263 (-) Transcript_11670:111-899(-)
MIRAAASLLTFATAVASPAFNTSRCKVGLSFSGLSPELTGDYIGNGNSFYRFAGHVEFDLGFTWKSPDRPQQAGWGCEFWDCSPEDKAVVAGKWAIASRTDFASVQMHVLAVCDEGCPDFKPSCGDIFNQPPDAPDLISCPIWPRAWQQPMKWRILNDTSGKSPKPVVVATTGKCCKRKPMECDACSSSSCGNLIGLFYNNCPPNAGSFMHPQSKFQKDCCVVDRPPPLELPVCTCGSTETQCDHDQEPEHEQGEEPQVLVL